MSLTQLKRTILIFALPLFGNSIGMAQACGYIFAKFYVQDSNGQFVDSAKLQLLRRATGESVAYAESSSRSRMRKERST